MNLNLPAELTDSPLHISFRINFSHRQTCFLRWHWFSVLLKRIHFLVLTLRLFSPSSILCRFLFSVNDAAKFRILGAVILQDNAKNGDEMFRYLDG